MEERVYVYNEEVDKILVEEGYEYTNEMPKYKDGNGYKLIKVGEKCLREVRVSKIGSKIRTYLYNDMMYVEVESSYGTFEYATHLELMGFKRDAKIERSTKVYTYVKKHELGEDIDIEYIQKAIRTLTALVNY